jgi:hypothetical protein
VRYLDSLNLKSNIECFILIEPGLGFLIPVLQERYKTSKIVVLHIDDFPQKEGIPTLNSIETSDIQKFLETHIPEIDIDRIKIIEWRASMNFYKDKYVKILSQVVEFLKRTDAGKRTTAVFGRRWVKNFFRNIANVNHPLLYKQAAVPVIVTGSAPGLEQAIPVIQKAQEKCLIIAASSSVMALSAGGITADIVIATDGGSWALKHIYPFYRSNNTAALAVNLCAALPSQCANTPTLLINDGSFWQSLILHALSLPSLIIPQRGTVTATAVELAMILSSGNIYLAGMDFSVDDIRTHTRPYSFDSLFFSGATRLTPFYSQSFTRSSLLREGGSMEIYAQWFKSQLAKWSKKIFSIGGNAIFDRGLPPEHTDKKKTYEYFKAATAGETSLFVKRGVEALLSAIDNREYEKNLKQELIPLLFPGEDNVTEKELKTAIKEIAGLKD